VGDRFTAADSMSDRISTRIAVRHAREAPCFEQYRQRLSARPGGIACEEIDDALTTQQQVPPAAR